MSSLRNAVQRRNHKERAQPKEREKWGLLEKHKDYALRAKDYNVKKSRLKTLRQKATERNPDEFSFRMLSSKSKGGQRIADRGNPILSHEAAKLLKTQDSAYLQIMIQKTKRAKEKLQGEITVNDRNAAAVHPADDGSEAIIFVEDVTQQERLVAELEPDLASTDARAVITLSSQAQSEPITRKGQMRSVRATQRLEDTRKEAKRSQTKVERERKAKKIRLTLLERREQELQAAENVLERQRAKMSNSVGGVNKAGVKFKIRERKR